MTALERKLQAVPTTPAWHLALDKFAYRLEDGLPSFSEPEGTKSFKSERLRQFRDLFNSDSTQTHLRQAINARQAFLQTLERKYGSCFRRVTLINTSRLLLHLGRASVLENVGLYCDRTTGLPLIPGTAVKGIVSTWACWEGWYGEELNPDSPPIPADLPRSKFRPLMGIESNLATRILGSDDTASPQRGEIVFLGAVPKTMPVMALDLVTPHTSGQPKPSPFLALEAGISWDFILIAPRLDDSSASTLLDQAARWLKEALTDLGIGAKGAAGYGRFDTRMPSLPVVAPPRAGSAEEAMAGQNQPLSSLPASSPEFEAETLRLAQLNKMLWRQFLKPEIAKLNPEQRQAFRHITSGSGFGTLRIETWYPKP
jgi:CRISPR-associated protein Cmr6